MPGGRGNILGPLPAHGVITTPQHSFAEPAVHACRGVPKRAMSGMWTILSAMRTVYFPVAAAVAG